MGGGEGGRGGGRGAGGGGGGEGSNQRNHEPQREQSYAPNTELYRVESRNTSNTSPQQRGETQDGGSEAGHALALAANVRSDVRQEGRRLAGTQNQRNSSA